MALTRPKIWDLDTNIEYFKDPLTTLHQGATLANVDVGFVFNRANGLVSNVALYWSESTQAFVHSYTTSSGTTDTNVAVTSYANISAGNVIAAGFCFANGTSIFSSVYGNATVATYLPTYTGTIGGDITVGGNLTVIGNTIFKNTEVVTNVEVVAGNLVANSGTASTGITTGALVVVGGVGISGALNLNNVGDVSANIGSLLANAGAQGTNLNSINANIGLYENTTNANIGTIFNNLNTLNANLGSYENTTNANIGLVYNHINILDANVGSYETATSSTLTNQATSINNINANVGSYEIANNANVGIIFNHVNTLDANVGAYEIANNANLGTVTTNITTLFSNAATQQTQITSLYTNANANVAAYLPLYAGSIGGTLTTASQPNVTTLAGLTSFGLVNTTTTAQGNLTVAGNLNVTGNINTIGNIYNVTITGNSGQFFGNLAGFGALYAGIPTGFSIEPQTTVQVSSNFNGYAQLNMQNINSGSLSSADFIVTANNGNANDTYIDMGMASSAYSYPGFGLLRPNDGYLLVYGNTTTRGGNLVLGAGGGGLDNDIIFAVGGFDTTNEFGRIDGTGNVFVIKSAVPSTSTTSGAVQVAGGTGIGGNLNIGGLVTNTSVTALAPTAILTHGADVNFQLTSQNGTSLNTTGQEVARFGVNYNTAGWDSFTQYIRGSNAQNGLMNFWAANTQVATIASTGLIVNSTIVGTAVNAATIGNANAVLYGTLNSSSAAQTNITSVGTLTGLTVSGISAITAPLYTPATWGTTAAVTTKGSYGGALSMINTGGSSDGFTFYLTNNTSQLNIAYGTNGAGSASVATLTANGAITVNGNISSTSGSMNIGTGGIYAAGSIYSDANWGMLFRSKQATPTQAEFRWANSADTELMRIITNGNVSATAFVGTHYGAGTGLTGTASGLTVGTATTATNQSGGTVSATTIASTQGISDVSGTGSALRIAHPGGASYATSTATVTGTIKIQLPVGYTSTMMRMTVKIYTYDGLSYELNLGGYNYSVTPTWINCFADMTTQARPALNVRFGFDGTYTCIYIGETTTVWNYPQVFVTDFQAGFSNYAASQWSTGWVISIPATQLNVTVTTAAQPPLPLSGGTLTGTLTTQAILPTASNTYAIGSTTAWYSGVYAQNFYGRSMTANYADLAENYISDSEYAPGTVVVFGGNAEITTTIVSHDPAVAGVISTNPAYLMNSELAGLPVAMTGRVPCQVQGPVRKGQVLVTSTTAGVAQAIDNSKFVPGCVIGKALEAINTNTIETIEVVVGRF